jgi:hypothetical protein
MNNFGCPWGGASYTEEQWLKTNLKPSPNTKKLITLANQYPDIICTLSKNEGLC